MLLLQVSYATSTILEGTTKHQLKLHFFLNKGVKYCVDGNDVQPLTDFTCLDSSNFLSSYTESYSSLVKMSALINSNMIQFFIHVPFLPITGVRFKY